jgi:hypothetical protein
MAFYRGKEVSELVSGWTSPPHNAASGSYFLSHNGTIPVWSSTPWSFGDIQIALAYRDTANFCLRECHGIVMSPASHQHAHETTGTYLHSGGDISNFTLASTTVANRRPDISATVIKDEDLPSTLSALTSKLYTRLQLSGAGIANLLVDQTDMINLSGNQPYYNQFTGGNWVQTLFPVNAYGKIFIMAIPTTTDSECTKNRYLFIQPQTVSTTLATINAITPYNVNIGHISTALAEYVFIGEIVVRYAAGNWTLISVSKLSGNRQYQVTSPSGSYLSTVSTNATLLGDGTVSNPLGVQTSALPASDLLTLIKTVDGAGSGLDTEFFQGQTLNRFPFGGGATAATSLAGQSVNEALNKSGFYFATDTTTGTPVAGRFYVIISTVHTDGALASMIALGTSVGSDLYYKTGDAGAWQKIWHEGNDGTGSGLDADLIDGIESTRIIYGDNLRGTAEVTDVDAIRKSGFYFAQSAATGLPTALPYFILHQQQSNSGNNAYQVAISQNGALQYYRTLSTTWNAWFKQWTENNDGTGSGLDADLLDGLQGSEYCAANAALYTGNIDDIAVTCIRKIGTGATGVPSGATVNGSMLLTMVYDSNARRQVYYEFNSSRTWERQMVSATWNIWRQNCITEAVQTTGNARTHTIAAMFVGESKVVAIDLRNTNAASQTISVVLPAGGTYSFHFNTPDSSATAGQVILNSAPNHVYGTVVAGGATVRSGSVPTGLTLQLNGIITRVS